MPISSGFAVVATLLRFIAASISMKFVNFARRIVIGVYILS